MKDYYLHFGERKIPVIKDPNKPMPFIHHSDDIWRKPQVIYGEEEKGLAWEYSDRLWEWNYKKSEEAFKSVESEHPIGSANYYQAYLRLFFDNPELRLVCIMGGTNLSTGYSYLVYGYRNK